MLKIDFKNFFRERMWFGWMCTHTLDGVGQWVCALDWNLRLSPVRLHEFEIDDYIIIRDRSSIGCTVYRPAKK